MFKILEHSNTIEAAIKKAINNQMLKGGALDTKFARIQNEIHELLYAAFIRSETYFSLTGGHLRAEFGLTDYQVSKLPALVRKMTTIDIDIDPARKTKGIMNIQIGFSDRDLLDFSKDGAFVTEKGDVINWLWWLLSAGEDEISTIQGYDVFPRDGAGRSRMAVMIRTEGRSYSIDGYYAGTPYDNWITRTLRANIDKLKSGIKDIMNAP